MPTATGRALDLFAAIPVGGLRGVMINCTGVEIAGAVSARRDAGWGSSTSLRRRSIRPNWLRSTLTVRPCW